MRATVTIENRRTLTIPNGTISATETEQIGKTLVNWAQDGYELRHVVPIQHEDGNQRDPHTRTDGVKLVLEQG